MDLSYVKQYLGEATEEKVSSTISIPDSWKNIIKNDVQKDRVQETIALWKIFYSTEFSVVLEQFEEFLTEVHLLKAKGEILLLYLFEVGDEVRYYVGKNPLTKKIPASIAPIWKALPQKLTSFYDVLHNGWYEMESEAMGLKPVESIHPLSNLEWSIFEEVELNFSLDQTIAFFSNAAGGYLCYTVENNKPEALIVWDEEAPDKDIIFWDVLDEWTAMGINEEE